MSDKKLYRCELCGATNISSTRSYRESCPERPGDYEWHIMEPVCDLVDPNESISLKTDTGSDIASTGIYKVDDDTVVIYRDGALIGTASAGDIIRSTSQ